MFWSSQLEVLILLPKSFDITSSTDLQTEIKHHHSMQREHMQQKLKEQKINRQGTSTAEIRISSRYGITISKF